MADPCLWRRRNKIDTRVPRTSVVTKRELSNTAKLSVLSVFVPIITYGHESSTMTEIMQSRAQSTEMFFLWKVCGATFPNKECSCEISKTVNVEPFIRVEKSQLRWMGNVTRMHQERLARGVLQATPTGMQHRGRPRTMVLLHLRPGLVLCRCVASGAVEGLQGFKTSWGFWPHDRPPREKTGVIYITNCD